MIDLSSLIRPSLRQLREAAASDLAQQSAAQSAPLVTWAGLSEPVAHLAERLTRVRESWPGRILCVTPAEYPVPDGVRAVPLPLKLFELLHPINAARYLIAYGGRASGKSWAYAIVLILEALVNPIRCLCAREFQNSLDESVHKLFVTIIERLGLERYFTVLRDGIGSSCGAEFTFIGLRHNTSKIRSYEGATHCWVEEATYVSEESWRTLVPTIRQPGSRFLISFNPDQETDPTYLRFVKSPPPQSRSAFVNWDGNPYISEEMKAERAYMMSVDPDAAAWIWDGHTRAMSNAIVFSGKYVVDDFTPAAGWDGPYFGLDLGFAADPSVLTKSWVFEDKLLVECEAWKLHCDIDRLPALLDQVPAARQHVIRCDSARPETVSYLKQHGFPKVISVEKWKDSVSDGVARMRAFTQIVLHPSTEHTQQEFRLYAFKTDRLSGDVLPEIIDRHNHALDSIRYALAPLIKAGGGMGIMEFYRDAAGKAEHRDAAVIAAQDGGMTATACRLVGRAIQPRAVLSAPVAYADQFRRPP